MAEEEELEEKEEKVEKKPKKFKYITPSNRESPAPPEGKVSTCCGAPVRPIEGPTGVSYQCTTCGKLTWPVKPEERREGLKPPTVELTEIVCEELKERLDSVYGIARAKVPSIIDTIRDNPSVALNPMNLFFHIKQLEPRANDYHLWTILNQVFEKLKASGWTGQVPSFPVFQQMMMSQYAYPFLYGPTPMPMYWWMQPYFQPTIPPAQAQVQFEYTSERLEHLRRQGQRETEEHQLRMRKLEEEIKAIVEGRAKPAPSEEKVKVEYEGKTVEVPVSLLPFFLGRKEEDKIPVKVGDTTFQVPVSLAPLYLGRESDEVKKLREEVEKLKDERHKEEMEGLKAQIGGLYERIDEISKRPSFMEELAAFEGAAERLGFKRSGRGALDILSDIEKDVHTTAQALLSRIPPQAGFRPEVTRTREERERLAKEMERKLEKSEAVLKAEEELIKVASEA